MPPKVVGVVHGRCLFRKVCLPIVFFLISVVYSIREQRGHEVSLSDSSSCILVFALCGSQRSQSRIPSRSFLCCVVYCNESRVFVDSISLCVSTELSSRRQIL